MKRFLQIIILFWFCLSIFTVKAQTEGIPLIRNYEPEEYHGFFQNWCAEQDDRGVMYFGNGKGILEYNGKNWRRFYTEKITTVLSMGKDSKGRIYIGAENEIGYLSPDSTGSVKFVSLMNKVPEKEREFGYVWHVYSNSKGIYFVTPEKVIRISAKGTKIYKPANSFFTAFMAKGQFFIQDQINGMFVEKNDSLVNIPDGKNYGDIRAVLPYRNQFLFATRNRGCFLFDGTNPPIAFTTQAESLLKEFQLYKGIVLADSSYAFATLSGGIVLMNRDGAVKNVINEKYGLLSNLVYYLYSDRQGELWACLGSGLSRIEVSSPFTYFNKFHGIIEAIQDLVLVKDKMFVCTLEGVFEMKNSFFDPSGFHHTIPEKIPNFNNQIFTGSAFSDGILFTGSGGVHYYDFKKFIPTFHRNNEVCVKSSAYHKDLYYVGGSGFVYAVRNENNRWNSHKIYDDGIEDFYYVAETSPNEIWSSTVNHGVFKFTFKDTISFESTKTAYDSSRGIPAGMTEVYAYNQTLICGSQKGLLSYNESDNKFHLASMFDTILSNGKKSVYLLSADKDQNLWTMYDKTINISKKQTKGNYSVYELPFRRLKFSDMYKILPGQNGITWFGGADGLIRYNENTTKDFKKTFCTVFNHIIFHKDTIFSGAYFDSSGYITTVQSPSIKNTFLYKGNAFIFEFAAASFDNEEFNMYSYFLEGFDEDWSDWTYENKKEFTNLPEGTYTFRVKSKNVYETEGNQAIYSFTILAPWYRTYWAYLIFIVAAIGLIYLIVILNTRRLRKANAKLEAIVLQRTEELRNRNAEITQQKEEIEAQRDEIEAQRDNLIILNEELHQKNEEIEAQRDEIEAQRDRITYQNKEMTDSIKYAEMIQSALMHPPVLLNSIIPESFILFKPKDIVSGDFYWFTEIDNKSYVAAVDCTGHGVPGGFMSMLGMSFLNEIASSIKLKAKQYTAADILFELRKMVIRSLNQTGFVYTTKNIANADHVVKDGMDISLCIIDHENNTLNFAGANNPLYIVKSEKIKDKSKKIKDNNEELLTFDFELHELKGDKMPIGAYTDNEKPFTNHTIEIEKGSAFYIFTDGYADQFGGKNGKKFKYDSLKKYLLSINQKPMNEQRKDLQATFEMWTNQNNNKYDQVDDVLIIGFKV